MELLSLTIEEVQYLLDKLTPKVGFNIDEKLQELIDQYYEQNEIVFKLFPEKRAMIEEQVQLVASKQRALLIEEQRMAGNIITKLSLIKNELLQD